MTIARHDRRGYAERCDDGGDDVVLNDDFGSYAVSSTYDNNGNLTKDADYGYVYDAWNNLVSVNAQNTTHIVIGTYKFFADDRRASKVVTNRGQLNGTTYYFYDNHEVIEERNSSEALVQQYVYGPNHIDELLMVRGLSGPLFTYQDPNWNVIAATNTRYAMADA